MRRIDRSCAFWIVLGPALLVCVTAAAGGLQAPDVKGDMDLMVRDGAVTAGVFGRAGSVIDFTSQVKEGSTVLVEMQVNNVVLEATIDLTAREVSWTGHGAALFQDDREALIAFAAGLEDELGAAKTVLPSHEQMLYRLAFYWAEAPVGMTLDRHQVTAAKPSFGEPKQRFALSDLEDIETYFEPSTKAAKCCYCADNDGITYLSCTYKYNVLCHDADNGGHCWSCESVLSGKGGNCIGECGPGCTGLNIFTWDCGDHDRCCQTHGGCFNPFDSNCGDEYGDAADDFLLGWPNC